MKTQLKIAAFHAISPPTGLAVLRNGSSRAQGSINQVLTNFAVGVANDTASSLAEFIAPSVPTGALHGQYKTFSSKDSFQVYNTARAVGGEATRIEFNTGDAFFNCAPQGLSIGIDDDERDPNVDPLMIEQAKIRTLVISSCTGHEAKVFALIKSVKAATGGVGVWSNAENDPVAELDAQIAAILTETGQLPNRMAMGVGAWRIIKNHPKVLARQPGAVSQGVTFAQFAGMLLNPEITIKMGTMSYDTTKAGKDKSIVNIVGGEVFLFIGSDHPTPYDPSFAKTFMPSATPITSVTEWRDDGRHSDMYETSWSEDIQVVSAQCARRITLS